MWPLASSGTTIRTFWLSGFVTAEAYGVSAIVFPAYLLSAGLGSKLSTWLVPPIMNSQITFLAFGGKVGPAVRRRPAWPVSTHDTVAMEHGTQDEPREAHAHVGQERPARRSWLGFA